MASPVVILYVCNENQCLGIRFILSIAGYSVLVANNDTSAIENLRRQPVDLILADQSLPRAILEKLLRSTKRLQQDAPIALLAPSSQGCPTTHGIDMILARDMEPSALLEEIAQAVSKSLAARAI